MPVIQLDTIKMPVFDPFTNVGTSQVFFQMLRGRTNPKAIADALGLQPPPIIQQLRRLQKIEVVRLGKKEGKLQNYDIDMDRFMELFVELAIQEKNTHPLSLHPEENDKLRSLVGNEYFRRFIVYYLLNLGPTQTISNASREFEDALLHSRSLVRPRKFDNIEKQQFFDVMRMWKRIAKEKKTFTEVHFLDALTKTLGFGPYRNRRRI